MRNPALHPLTSSGFANLMGLLRAHGAAPAYFADVVVIALLSALREPAAWLEAAHFGRRVARQAIRPAPVFVVGHWRSGTTHLQNLMCRDPQFARVTLLQAATPREFLSLPAWLVKLLAATLPERRLMDNVAVSADAPWEEEMALTSLGRLSFYHVSFFPRAVATIFREAVLLGDGDPALVAAWRRQYLHFLRKVQFADPDRRLLLKNPANTARLALLAEMFPGARFVHIHRNPYEVFASTVHLYLRTQAAWGLHAVDRAAVVDHVLESYPALMRAYFAQVPALGPGALVEIGFDDLQRDPEGALRSIYRGLALDGFEAALPAFRRYIESLRHYAKNVLDLPDAERRQVQTRWAEIFERLGYPA